MMARQYASWRVPVGKWAPLFLVSVLALYHSSSSPDGFVCFAQAQDNTTAATSNTTTTTTTTTAATTAATTPTGPDDEVLCTLCYDGTTPSGSYPGGLDCGMIAAAIGNTPVDSADCRDTQISAYEHCSCGALPPGICPLCANGTVLAFPHLPLPSNGGGGSSVSQTTTCREVAFATKCLDVTYDAAWYCGCVSAGDTRPMPDASICNATTTADTVSLVHVNRILPHDLTTTCLQYDRTLGVLGATVGAVDTSPVGDLPAYCGCPEVPVNIIFPNQCDICAGELLLYPNRVVVPGTVTTCGQLQTMADHVTDAPYCSTLQQDYGTLCCKATAAPVTVAPNSPAPVTAPPVAAAAPVPPVGTPVAPPVAPPMAQTSTSSATATARWRPAAGLAVLVIGGLPYLLFLR